MKISIDNRIKNYSDMRLHTKENAASYAVSDEEHSYDSITIQSDTREIEERSFAASLAKEISSEIKDIAASPEKIEELRSQIESQSYTPDAYAIAARMLYS